MIIRDLCGARQRRHAGKELYARDDTGRSVQGRPVSHPRYLMASAEANVPLALELPRVQNSTPECIPYY
jgi:hypothetical protein